MRGKGFERGRQKKKKKKRMISRKRSEGSQLRGEITKTPDAEAYAWEAA
jgi:hypothetical protein